MPTYITEVETAFDSTTTPKTTASFSVEVGDIIVAYAVKEDSADTLSVPTNSGTAFTWTERQSVDFGSNTEARLWTTTATAAQSMTVTFAKSAGALWWGGGIIVFRGGTIGTSGNANTTGAPSLAITTGAANSAIVVVVGDWNAVDGASRTWRTGAGAATEMLYFRSSVHYAVYAAYHADAGAAASKTVGLSAPTGQQYAIIALEIQDAGGAAFILPRSPQVVAMMPLLPR